MTVTKRTSRSKRKAKSKPRYRENLQKPTGVIGPRVAKVGGERFAIVCVDPAKERSEWMMADYFGNLLIPHQTLTHQATFFRAATVQIRHAQEKHDIQDMIVVVERTANYYLAPKRAFAKAGFEVRIVHPFATKQYRMPADPGDKTDENDLYAQHRAAVAGFGLCESELASPYRELRLRVRHRRNLVERSSAIACQLRDHLHLFMPGYATLFDHLFDQHAAMAIARRCYSPRQVLEVGRQDLSDYLRDEGIRHQLRTVDKVLAWASQAAADSIDDGPLHQAIWTDLEELYQHFRRRIRAIERTLAGDLVKTPYVRLLAIPGINVSTAAEFAAEMGPIDQYANANAITGRAGLFPCRHQSDQTDRSGPLVRQANRRLRCALMRIADSLAGHCPYYRGLAELDRARGLDVRASRVKTAKKFTRLAFACVAGNEPMNHPAFRQPESILEKLRAFHHAHDTPVDRLLADLKTTVEQLPYHTRGHEAKVVAAALEKNTRRKRGAVEIGAVLPAVLARLGVDVNSNTEAAIQDNQSSEIDVRDRS